MPEIQALTPREITLFREALRWRKAYDDAEPDVGMGPSRLMLVEEISARTGIPLNDADKKTLSQG